MIGILNASHFDLSESGQYQIIYSRMFFNFVADIFPEYKDKIKEYKVAQGQFPNSVEDCEIWFMTGSSKSVYEDLDWVKRLTHFTQNINVKKKKLIGICFGHQMAAYALGGKVSRCERGWGVGVRQYDIIHTQNWMQPQCVKLKLIFSHQDQVDELPPDAILLGSDGFCPNQMFQVGEHILTFQGHPEYSLDFAKYKLNYLKERLPLLTYDRALESLNEPNDFKLAMDWIRNFSKI